MKYIHKIIGALTGAIALNAIHQFAAHYSKQAPRVDLIGKEALNKGLDAIGLDELKGDTLFDATLAGDIASNAMYFSLIGKAERKNLVLSGAVIGASAGIGALTLTAPLGLDDKPVNKSTETKLMTVAWYTLGGLIAGLTMRAISK